MKPLIIPTDFSPAADHAVHYGAQLAQAIQTSIVLLHVYMIPVTINETPVLAISGEELKKSADAGLLRTKEELQKTYPSLTVSTESRMGDVAEELKQLCAETESFAVVMGTHSTTAAEQLFFGSNTVSAIRKVGTSVLTVPLQYSYQPITNIVLATDLQYIDKTPTAKIIEAVTAFNASLHIVHISTEKEADAASADKLLQLLQTLKPDYKTLQDEDVRHGLETYTQQVAANLLIVLPHEHSWLENFFLKLHTKDLVHHAQLPVLYIPEPKTPHS